MSDAAASVIPLQRVTEMVADTRPAPLNPPHVDVRDLDSFMLNIERLLASELVATATGEECWRALMLWARSWKQVPAGSLPNDDRALGGFSGAGARWGRVKKAALHGFVECSDGRLYHPVVCAEALRAFNRKRKYQKKRETDRKRLKDWRKRKRPGNGDETRSKRTDTGTGTLSSLRSESSLRSDPSPLSPLRSDNGDSAAGGADLWNLGATLLGRRRRGLLGKMLKSRGEPKVREALAAVEREQPADPVSFFVACCDGEDRITAPPPAERRLRPRTPAPKTMSNPPTGGSA
jgi:Protein of unknown function (DUF1376)